MTRRMMVGAVVALALVAVLATEALMSDLQQWRLSGELSGGTDTARPPAPAESIAH